MKYPIGIQTFEKIITGGYTYVDKTDLVYKLVSSGDYYFLSRPRRFGKSLLTTTIEAYFQGRKDLFKGLVMEKLEKDWIEYPVFHIDFSSADYTNPTTLTNRLNTYLSQWEKIYGKNDVEIAIGDRLYGVVSRAKEKTGKLVVILVDEYDKPLTDAIGIPEIQDANRALLQEVYGIMKRADRHIRFAFLTGVTRYGKLGIFSAANNPRDISMSNDYATICGITETELHSYFDNEIKQFAEKQKIDETSMYNMLKHKYDGYHFCEHSEDVYNPFSVLNALSDKQLSNYWFATGTPTYLVRMLQKSDIDIPDFEDDLMTTEEMLATFGNGDSNVIAALYQSGYLTIKGFHDNCYILGFPNDEVSEGLTRVLIPNYVTSSTSDRKDLDIIKLRQLIDADNIDGFMTQMQIIMSQIPFESNNQKLIEANFRNMLYLMIRATGHKVSVEYPVLGGRIDVFFETKKCAYIIECKRNQSAQEALDQIDEKRYAEKISAPDKMIVKIGVNFSTDERNLTEWKVD